MPDIDQKSLTPKEGCEECNHLHDNVDYAKKSNSYLTNGLGTGYRRGKSRSKQPKQVREQMNSNENAERLARAELRMHEMVAHEGVTLSNASEYQRCLNIKTRDGRDRP